MSAVFHPVGSQPLRLLQDSLRRAAQAFPFKPAIVAGKERLNYSDLWHHSVRLANALKARGVARGDRVAIQLENGWQCAVAIFGSLLADATFVLVNPKTKRDKLVYILEDSGAGVLLIEAALLPQLQPALPRLRRSLHILVAGLNGSNLWEAEAPARVESLSAAIAEASHLAPEAAGIALDLAALIYTSGSTGEPKGVMHSHQSMRFALESLVEYLRIEVNDHILCMLPLAFDYGLYQLLMAVQVGATVVLERSFAYPAQILKLLDEEQISVFPGVPTVYAMLLATDEKTPLRFPGVRTVTNTAAALPASYNDRLRTMFPNARLYRMYGLTECKRVCYLDPALIDAKPDSVGRAIPGTEVLLLDDDGQPVPPGTRGKLHVRGPHVMLGYWNQPEKTAHMLRDGPTPGERMLCTHDWFTRDAEGDLYFVGRSDDIIKCRGEKVSPVEVESVIYRLNGVRDAAVLGVPDPIQGQAIHAVVSLNDGVSLDEASIRRWCATHLENHMVPSRIVLLDELPKSANGKVDSRALAALLVRQERVYA